MKYLYKYPHRAYPYDDLVATNAKRGRHDPEYELIDTGVFSEDRYFDIMVEYAKDGPEDLLLRIGIINRGQEPAAIDVLPTLWFRNTWSWREDSPRPELRAKGSNLVEAIHPELGKRYLHCEGKPELLFTENETNRQRLWQQPNRTPFVKDAFHEYVIHAKAGVVNPERRGTKVAARYHVTVPPGQERVIRLRLTDAPEVKGGALGKAFDACFAARIKDADEFYGKVLPASLNADHRQIARQALAGMLWSKQFYRYDVMEWCDAGCEDPNAPKTRQNASRNRDWSHMVNEDVISMPDKWEYPWYAAWDLAFHCVPLAMVDTDFARGQLDIMLREHYLHPNGQLPAYEWNFGDVNPPVHAWAAYYVYQMCKSPAGEPSASDLAFFKHAFQKLLMNFTWWVNRKDQLGRNVFEGGFLGLDNIGVFDRSAPLPVRSASGGFARESGVGVGGQVENAAPGVGIDLDAVDEGVENPTGLHVRLGMAANVGQVAQVGGGPFPQPGLGDRGVGGPLRR